MECAVPPQSVSEKLGSLKLSTDLETKNVHSSRNKNAAFAGFKKGFLSNASNNKKKAAHNNSKKTDSCSNDCSKSNLTQLHLSISEKSSESNSLPSMSTLQSLTSELVSIKSTSGPNKPVSSKVPIETSKLEGKKELSLVSEDSELLELTSGKSQSSSATCKGSQTASSRKSKTRKPACAPQGQAQSVAPSLVTPEMQEALRNHDATLAFHQAAHARLTPSTTVNDILEDPSWLAILAEFQEDAEVAMVKYKDNAEVRSVMTKLCATLGDNFLNLKSSTGKKSEDDALVERLMHEQSVRDALQSPLVQRILDLSKAGRNDAVTRLMTEASNEDRQHIRTLLDFGLFSFSC